MPTSVRVPESRQLLETSQARVVIALSQRSYLDHVGGIEHCLRMEMRLALQRGFDYLHIHPIQSQRPPITVFGAAINGAQIDVLSLNELLALLGKRSLEAVIIHSSIGLSYYSALDLLLTLRQRAPVVTWLHDLSYACGSVNLIRDGQPCGVPALGAAQCGGCVHEPGRAELARQSVQAGQLSDLLIFPSEIARSRYNSYLSGIGKGCQSKQSVLPHYISEVISFAPATHNAPFEAPHSFAYFGHSSSHKGWESFMSLIDRFQHGSPYQYFHVGDGAGRDRRVTFLPFREAESAHASLAQLCREHRINLAFFWPNALESFGIMLRQALAAGCAVICPRDNPALYEGLEHLPQLACLDSLDEVAALLAQPNRVAALVEAARLHPVRMHPSEFSFALLGRAREHFRDRQLWRDTGLENHH